MIKVKPSFIKGKKSYMLVDSNACNKPLTLDCQVTSNPPSNITWYRRRLSRTYLNKHYQDLFSSNQLRNENNKFYDSLFGMLSYKIDVNSYSHDLFEDEPIEGVLFASTLKVVLNELILSITQHLLDLIIIVICQRKIYLDCLIITFIYPN